MKNVAKNLKNISSETDSDNQGEPGDLNNENETNSAIKGLVLSDQEIFADFISSQEDNLLRLQENILALEKSPENGIVSEIKRQFHTMKGDAGLLGLYDVESMCHFAEDILDVGSSNEMVNVLLEIKDWLNRNFSICSGVEDGDLISSEKFISEKKVLINKSEDVEIIKSDEKEDENKIEEEVDLKEIDIDPEIIGEFVTESLEHLEQASIQLLNLETDSQNKEALDAIFRAFHTIKGGAGFLGFDSVKRIAHEAEALLEQARKGEFTLSGKSVDVIFDSIDALKFLVEESATSDKKTETDVSDVIEHIKGIMNDVKKEENRGAQSISSQNTSSENVGEILIKLGKATIEDVKWAAEKQKEYHGKPKIGEILIKDHKVLPIDVAHALRSQKDQSEKIQSPKQVIKETIKMDSGRLGNLLDTIGELVIVESMVQRSIVSIMKENSIRSAELERQVGHLEKITRKLQESATSMRMVPLRSVFQKMARLVRDLSRKSGKKTSFKMKGEDTELDKSVVDVIGDPLIHMIRNSVDHGIEYPQDRKKLGKSEEGNIELRAFHQGGNIYIEIEDDGRGLDPQKILEKGKKSGIVGENDNLSEDEIYNLIFAPGFSTAEQVTDISGRGVGMDVVNRTVESLRGQINIKSQKGKGITFSFRLPLTLAIIDGMIIGLEKERFIIPSLLVEKTLKMTVDKKTRLANGMELYSLDDCMIPLIKLSEVFGLNIDSSNETSELLVVVVKAAGTKAGIIINEVIDKQQVVIKGLGEAFKDSEGISGGAIMSDGNVGLILDVDGIVKVASEFYGSKYNQ
ncbi:MAG: Hpt domain-containing protein [Bacteriovoracaceae bacterium]|nr:Hpt domain-containing protein [Bacteriovoracaceae bacterium]